MTQASGAFRWLCASIVAATSAAVLVTLPGTAGATSEIVDLGIGRAVALNDHGTVIGSDQPTGYGHAVRWDTTGYKQYLDILPGYTYSETSDINEGGTIAGSVSVVDADGRVTSQTAVRWDRLGRISRLGGVAGRPFTVAIAINDSGVITGQAGTTMGPDTQLHAIRWNWAGQPTDLGSLPNYTNSAPTAINNNGTIVGVAYTTGPDYQTIWRAVLWDDNDRITNLATLPGDDQSSAWYINDAGTIVGISYSVDGPYRGTIVGFGSVENNNTTHALLWNPAGRVTDLGALPGNTYSTAWRINNDGTVIGQALATDGEHAVLWHTLY